MSGPTDDERVRQHVAALRAWTFAIVSAVVGAMIVQDLLVGKGAWWTDPALRATQRPAIVGWLAAGPTLILAWRAARGERSRRAMRRAAWAGALNGPATAAVLLLVPATQSFGAHEAVVYAVGAALCSGIGSLPLGGVLGLLFGAALVPLQALLERTVARPALTTMPSAHAIAGTWVAVILGCAAFLGSGSLAGAREIAGALAVISCAGACAGWLVVAARVRLARRAARGEVAGWRVDRDDDGTRWLVREERGGDGAYREGVMSRRWARV